MVTYKVVDADKLDADLTVVAEAIREKTSGTEALSFPDGMASEIDAVFAAGATAGTDAFWDKLQDMGSRTDYRSAFMATGFTHIDPKYPIKASYADTMMSQAKKLVSVNWDKFDLSNAGSLYSAFSYCDKLKRIDTVLGIANGSDTFMNSLARQCFELTSIQKIMALPSYVWKQSFDYCYALTHVIFEGTIGKSGLNLQWSTGLDRESIESVVNALSATTTGLTVTLSLTAVNTAFETSTGAADGSTSEEWLALAATKTNWTIALA